ncbi:hypothetical protein, partial [uncultured Halomonas sp.]|uniref:hypothetical protein n=1 Tax=uncultured Halomonas sp. TaxID=173971 RepID=UPI002634EA4A
MHSDILAFARQHDVNPTTVDFMVGHIMRELGDAIEQAGGADEQLELVRAGVESSVRTTRAMATRALAQQGEFGKVVYDIL